MKKALFLVFFLFLSFSAFATITNFSVRPQVRLGENLTIIGNYSVIDAWCKFDVFDSNNILIERLNDIKTFDDGSFTAIRKIDSTPYFVGDDYNAVAVCGTDKNGAIFSVVQPVSLAQPIQRTWEFWFDPGNQTAIMFLASMIAIIIIIILVGVFVAKKVGSFAP